MSKTTTALTARLPLIGAGLLWSGFHAWVLYQYVGFRWDLSLWDSSIFNLVLISTALLLSSLLNYFPRTGIFQITIGLTLVLTVCCQWISSQAMIAIFPAETAYLEFLAQSTPVRWALGFTALTAVGVSTVFYMRWAELQDQQTRELDLKDIARGAELQKLQLQLQPHFLFNSLNSINALILVQPDSARQMVQQLSDFLRLTLKRADQPWVTLAQELEYLETYLAIEKVRFGHRLEVVLNIEGPSRVWLIPTLVLQPLLENAIKFGLYGTTGKITIRVTAAVRSDFLEIEIVNPFDADMQPTTGSGFGLSGLQRRLYLIYAQSDLIKTKVMENNFSVSVRLPFRV